MSCQLKLNFQGSTHQITVQPGETILEAARDQNLDVPFSCSTGSCGACQARLISGQVDMPDDAYLTPGEIAEGHILMCLAKPQSDEIEVTVED